LLTRTDHDSDNTSTFTPIMPFSFVRRAADYSRSMDAVFTLSPGEKIFGCGESFTSLDKRGQKIVLWTDDANGIQNQGMYKPIPFFMSNRGYGMFIHTSSPITCDFGNSFSGVNSLMIGDDALDLFVFFGSPKEILDEYTTLTGKSPLPPLWSFGLWMSRCTYSSGQQVRDVAAKLRENKIPCDVIHLDTGWFETDWRCDYQFSTSRFADPQKMIADLKSNGFHISLWQLPYFVPQNTLFNELVEKNLVVRDAKGNLPDEDAVLDFSNPKTVEWYQDKLAGLLKMGVGAIKVDFGEAAPENGLYASGRTGFYEHNLYPLRYN
jgi:alpha-D-xyloside xylohydrolase